MLYNIFYTQIVSVNKLVSVGYIWCIFMCINESTPELYDQI